MDSILSNWSITLKYLALVVCGIIYAIFILIGAGLSHIHIPGIDLHIGDHGLSGGQDVSLGHDVGGGHEISVGHDVGVGHEISVAGVETGATVDHPTVKVPSLSPVTIASFVTAFGAFGLISMGLFEASAKLSLLWAAGGGFVIAVIAHFAFGYFLIAPQGSSEVRMRDILGAVAEIITPVPSDSVGEIAFVAQGGRVTYTAKSADGTAIQRGTTVVIEKIVGGVAVVRPQMVKTNKGE